jgi:hypothetical protein
VVEGATVRDVAGAAAMSAAEEPVTPSAIAVMTALPECMRETSPLPDTFAALGFDDTQATRSAATGLPDAPIGAAKIRI